MNTRKVVIAVALLSGIAAFGLMGQISGQTVRIGGESLRANGQLAQGFQYTGSCPVNLKFGWGVIANQPTVISYTFQRSDGGHSSSSLSANLPQGNRSWPIYDDWQLGANTPRFANFTGWVKIVIAAPNPVEGKIGFTIHCQ